MDINHNWGADLAVGPTGDLSLVDGDTETKQRILRRLLTNNAIPGTGSVETVIGDYLFHQEYGAGVPRRIGTNLDEDAIKTQITAQMLQEEGVAQSPEPTVQIRAFAGGVQCTLGYTSSMTNTPQILDFTVS